MAARLPTSPTRTYHVRTCTTRQHDAAADPIEKLFRRTPAALGNLSYAQYALQFIAYGLWPAADIVSMAELGLFMAVLLSISYLASSLLITPCAALRPSRVVRSSRLYLFSHPQFHFVPSLNVCRCAALWLRCRPFTLLLLATTVSAICGGACYLDEWQRSRGPPVVGSGCGGAGVALEPLPAYVRVAAEAVDVRLNWTAHTDDFAVRELAACARLF